MSKDALAAVAQHSAARGPALLVAFRLADHTNRQGWSWPSIPLLVEETGFKRDTVMRGLAWLEETGELHVERARNRRGNRYRLRLPGVPGSTLDEAPDALGTVAHVDTSESENGRSDRPERSANSRSEAPERSLTSTRTERTGNRENLAAPPRRIGDTVDVDRSCPACRGSMHVLGEDGTAYPCPRCRP